jgi:hypothetical protein
MNVKYLIKLKKYIWLGVVAHACNLSYLGGGDEIIMVQSQSHVLCVTELPQAHKLSPVHPD